MTDTKKDKIYAIFNQAFSDDPVWNDWYFSNVYDDAEAMLLDHDGKAVSSLLVEPYCFRYLGSDLRLAYLSGVATARGQRGRGYMSALLQDALRRCHDRGYALAAVVPAADHLYFFYDKFGFTTVVYVDCERYTSLHTFATEPRFTPVDPTAAGLQRLESGHPASVIHSDGQFDHILADNAHDRGVAVAIADNHAPRLADGSLPTVAMAFAVPSAHSDTVTVRAMWAESAEAAEAVLSLVRDRFHDRPIEVWAQPVNPRTRLRARAMLRILDAHALLSAMAATDRRIEQVIQLHDKIIPANNGIYIIRDGRCTRTDSTMRHITLDVDISVLATILFSAPKVGHTFGIRTERPALPLMLD